jgi:activator of 2-hydroxyglutaryl-CoA dehydratase
MTSGHPVETLKNGLSSFKKPCSETRREILAASATGSGRQLLLQMLIWRGRCEK